ncbi:MAG: polyphosphate kinase 2 family protein [Chitinispirillales bacterium]|jgi:PPK2 family polyphosphate:nucleotide phosphotransferase|nr:polyphosphate kinase 2 family protein [Chitinispirillales bacterium]
MNVKKYTVTGENLFGLEEFDTGDTGGLNSSDDVKKMMKDNIVEIAKLQDRLYAEGKTGLLIIFQAMDAAGKDSAIKHVMSGVNPQGVEVVSFKQPSTEELSHDYLWRAAKALPPRGKIAIFNRSYYEDVLVVKVHKLYENMNLPDRCKGKNIIEKRYAQIRNFEDYLWENGIVTVKFFLHLSRETQLKRFLERIDNKDKNWKFSDADVRERKYWDDYQEAYRSAIEATASKNNPWYVIPADKKWYTRAVISNVLLSVMKKLNPRYPIVTKEQEEALAESKKKLENPE